MILFVKISNFWQSYLVARILVLQLIQDVFAPSYYANSVVPSMPWITTNPIAANTQEIG